MEFLIMALSVISSSLSSQVSLIYIPPVMLADNSFSWNVSQVKQLIFGLPLKNIS
jgi:hypothetical protein